MATVADIDLEQVDRDFDVAVRMQIDAADEPPSDAPPSVSLEPSRRRRTPGLGALASAAALAFALAGTAACVVGIAGAVRPVADLLFSTGHADVRHDLACAGAWLSAGAAGILMAVGFRRTAADRDDNDPGGI